MAWIFEKTERYEPTVDDFEEQSIIAAKLISNGCASHWHCNWNCPDRERN